MSENSKKSWHRLERLEREARSYNDFLRACELPSPNADESLEQPLADVANQNEQGDPNGERPLKMDPYKNLPVERLRVIDEKTQRQGRVIVNCEESVARFGKLETRFECPDCEIMVAVGARLLVGKILYRCSCGALLEVTGVAAGRETAPSERRPFWLNSDGS